jgi:hypothetical protein
LLNREPSIRQTRNQGTRATLLRSIAREKRRQFRESKTGMGMDSPAAIAVAGKEDYDGGFYDPPL